MAGIPKIKITFDADFDELKKGVKGAQNEVEGFGSKMGGFAKKAGAAFAVAGAAAAAYAGVLLVDGVKSAIEDEAAQAKLATTLKNVTDATDDQIKAVEDYITQTALANGITDDQLRPSLDRLIRSTKDATKAQELQSLALDIAAGTGKDLKTVSEALGKAYDGNLGALKKLGVGIDDSIIKSKNFDAAAAALSKTFEGQASKQAETFQGKMARLTVAFDEAKETVGSYVLDALTPLLSGFVDKGIPAIQGFADTLGKTLGPAFGQIFKVIRDDLLPILTSWWKFLYNEIIPAIGKIVGPILEGLKIAFDKIKKAISDNSDELEPFYGFLEKVWDFTKKYLVPLLGGAFKTTLEGLGTLVAGLVTAFGKFVGLLTGIYNGAKKVIDLIKDNPVTRLFGASNASFVGASESQGLVFGGEDGSGGQILDGGFQTGTPTSIFAPTPDSPTFTGAPLGAYSPAMQAAILRREELKAETERLRKAREDAAAARLEATGGQSTADRITVNFGVVGDPEAAARALVDVLNRSSARGGGGFNSLVNV
jgi:phage-related protein